MYIHTDTNRHARTHTRTHAHTHTPTCIYSFRLYVCTLIRMQSSKYRRLVTSGHTFLCSFSFLNVSFPVQSLATCHIWKYCIASEMSARLIRDFFFFFISVCIFSFFSPPNKNIYRLVKKEKTFWPLGDKSHQPQMISCIILLCIIVLLKELHDNFPITVS